jgi:hypothetical protein
VAAFTTLKQVLTLKLERCDLVLAKTVARAQQTLVADLGRLYRFKYLFKDPKSATQQKQIDFVGGGCWDQTLNYAGEVGFLFLSRCREIVHQQHWEGRIPIERHSDGLWCSLFHVKMWGLESIPEVLLCDSKPDMQRPNSPGLPAHIFVRFEALEAYMKDLIAELDHGASEFAELVDIQPWLELIPRT